MSGKYFYEKVRFRLESIDLGTLVYGVTGATFALPHAFYGI